MTKRAVYRRQQPRTKRLKPALALRHNSAWSIVRSGIVLPISGLPLARIEPIFSESGCWLFRGAWLEEKSFLQSQAREKEESLLPFSGHVQRILATDNPDSVSISEQEWIHEEN